jgi:peptide/nickel transport system permease protein
MDAMLPMEADAEEYARMEKHWGLDKPLHTQYLVFLKNAVRGDFGKSWKWQGYTAMGLVLERLPATLELGGAALAISVVLALPIGVLSAVMKDTPIDSFGKIIALLGQSLPSFWLGIVLMWIFAVMLGWLPTSGRGGLERLILPAISLGWFQVAVIMRLVRSSMLDVLDSEFVKLTRIKGLSEWKVVWKHCLRNAALVPLTYFAINAGVLITGSVVIESVFAWPGTGLLAVDAVRARDFQVVQAIVIVFSAVFLCANLVVDILYAYLDPRIRYQ